MLSSDGNGPQRIIGSADRPRHTDVSDIFSSHALLHAHNISYSFSLSLSLCLSVCPFPRPPLQVLHARIQQLEHALLQSGLPLPVESAASVSLAMTLAPSVRRRFFFLLLLFDFGF
jgi:hypothetical protein